MCGLRRPERTRGSVERSLRPAGSALCRDLAAPVEECGGALFASTNEVRGFAETVPLAGPRECLPPVRAQPTGSEPCHGSDTLESLRSRRPARLFARK